MAEESLAERFAGTYSGNRRIGKSVTAFSQKPKVKRPELAAWFEADAIESLNQPIYEAKRMIGIL